MLCWLMACLLTAPPAADSESFEIVRKRPAAGVATVPPLVTDPKLLEIVRKPSDEALAQAVSDLGHAEFAVRERASLALWCCGTRAKNVLQKAAESKDLEVRTRAKQLLTKLQKGETPNVQDPRLRGIVRFRSGRVQEGVSLLLEREDDATALLLLEELPVEQHEQFEDVFARVHEHSARKQILADRIEEAESLLRRAVRLQSKPAHACRQLAALLFALGRTPEELSRPESVESLGGAARHKLVLAWLLKARGEFGPAAKLAAETDDVRLQQALRIELNDWATMFAEAEHDESSNLRGTTLRLALLPQFGREDQAAGLLNNLRAIVDEKPVLLDQAVWELLLAQRPTDALDLAREVRHHTMFKLRIDDLRFREAFAALGLDLPLRDPEAWFDKLWANPPKSGKDEWIDNISNRARDAALVAQIVWRLGEPEIAQRLMRKAGDLAETDAAHGWGLRSVWRNELKLGLEARAWQHLGQAVWNLPDHRNQSLSPQRPIVAGVWWETRRAAHPDESFADSARFVVRLAAPETAPGLSADEARAEIESLAQSAPKLSADKRPRWLRAAAESAALHQLGDMALSLWLNVDSVDPTSRTALAIADGYAAKQAWTEAAQWYERVWNREPADAKSFRSNGRDEEFRWDMYDWRRDPLRLLSLILRARALSSAGDETGAERCRRLARIWPLGDAEMRMGVAYELDRRGLHDAALDQFVLARAFAHDENELSNIFIHLAEQRADTDPAEAARLWGAVGLLTMQDGAFLTSDDVDVPYAGEQILVQRIHQLNAKSLIAAGDIEHALQTARMAEAACPIHLKLTVELVPLFEKASAPEAAGKLFEQLWRRRQSVLADFPNAAEFHDQLASLGATCRRELDASLTHARRAIELRPKHAPFLITLTRVHLARRELDQARQRFAEAQALAPSHPELIALKRQLDEAASPPEKKQNKQ